MHCLTAKHTMPAGQTQGHDHGSQAQWDCGKYKGAMRGKVVVVVGGAVFLTCDLSRTVTGQTLIVDGGTYAAFGFLDWPGGDSFMPAPLGGKLKMMLG